MPINLIYTTINVLHLLNCNSCLPREFVDFLNLVSAHNGAAEDAVICAVRYRFTGSCHHDLSFVSLMKRLLIGRWVLLDVGTGCVCRDANVIVLKHSLTF